MKKKFWLGAFALLATICCSVGAASVNYTVNAEDATVEETSFELLDETASFDNSNAGLTYDIKTKTGRANKADGTIDNKLFSYTTKEYVNTADGVKAFEGFSAEYSVTYSNVGTLAQPDTNFIGVVFSVDGYTIKYRVGSVVNYGAYDYLPLGSDTASPFAISTTGNKRNLKTQVLSETDNSVTIVFKFTPKVGDTNGSYTITVDGVEAVTYEYGSTSLPTMGLQVGKNTADISNASIKVLGAMGWYVEDEPETTYDMFSNADLQHSVVADGSTAAEKFGYDFTNKVGYIGGSASGIGVAEKERAKAYFEVATPDKVVAEDDTLIDYSAVEKMEFSITYSDIQAVDGTFDANNNNEFIAIALIDPNATNDWAGLWVMGAQIYNHIGVIERNLKGTGLFENGDTTANIRFGGKTSPVVEGSVTLSILVTKATDDAVGSIEVLWNGVTATTINYSGKVFPGVGMYSRGVCAKVSNVSYTLFGVKDVHEHTEETLTAVAPTCTETGLTEGKKCSVCEMVLVAQETVSAAHKTTKTEAVAPTCTEAGNVAYWTCSGICGKVYSNEACTMEITDTVAPAAGHNATKTDAIAPTCTAEGSIDFWFCDVCSKIFSDEACKTEVEDVVVPAAGHTEETLAAQAPTCTESGLTEGTKCSVCSEVLVEQEVVPAAGHTEETLAAQAPTCTETGLTEGTKCSVCDEVLVAQEVVPAGHTEETLAAQAPTCTETGLSEGTKCCVCDEVLVVQEEISATGHTESDWIVDSEAQVDVAGSKHKECTVCGETTATEDIPALEAPKEELFGGMLAGCFGSVSGLSVVALMGFAAVVALRKKED